MIRMMVLFILFGVYASLYTQENLQKPANAIEISPLSPLMNIYAVHLSHMTDSKNEFITGPVYMKIKYDCGYTDAGGIILGYRRYFSENIHAEYQIWPIYDNFYESNEQKRYKSFDVWNEFRVGYLYDFQLLNQNAYVNIQWPFGFALYAGNKPDSFIEMSKKGDNRFFYYPPLIFIGVRY